MDGFFEHQLVCRACLRIVENKSQAFGFIQDSYGNLKDMIMCCVPEMDIYVSSNPIMCLPCIQQLITVYHFKTRCLNSETVIRSYMHRNNLKDYNHVNLGCVIQDLIKLNREAADINQNKPGLQAPQINLEPLENQGSSLVKPDTISENELFKLIQNETGTVKLENERLEQEEKHGVDIPKRESSSDGVNEHNLPVRKEAQQTIHCIPMPPHLVQNNFPYPHMVHRGPVPVNYVSDRIIPLPPYPMGERLRPPPHMVFEHRFRPYNFPMLRPQMPEKVFMSPQFSAQQSFAPRSLSVPSDGMYPSGDIEQSLQQYTVQKDQVGEKIFCVLPNRIEENVANPAFERCEGDNDNSDTDKRDGTKCEESVVEKNVDSLVADDENKDKETLEDDSSGGRVKNGEESETNRARIILRIDKNRIREFFEHIDKNEDSNEKENEEQDVGMEENGV